MPYKDIKEDEPLITAEHIKMNKDFSPNTLRNLHHGHNHSLMLVKYLLSISTKSLLK